MIESLCPKIFGRASRARNNKSKQPMNKTSFCLCVVAGLLFAAPAFADKNAVLDRDMRTFLEWFPGVYDNQEQVYFEKEMGVPEDLQHERIHHTFARVDLPAFGDNVFYVQQYLDDDPEKIYRQRIYVFTADYEENAIRLSIHTPNDVASLVDAHLDPSKLEGLTPEDTRHMPGCDVFWRKRAAEFDGQMKPGACSFVSQRSGKRIVIDDDLILTDSEIWISDRAEDEDGNYGVMGMDGYLWGGPAFGGDGYLWSGPMNDGYLWGGQAFGDGYLWGGKAFNDGYLWSGGGVFNDGYLWGTPGLDGYLWGKPGLEGYLWSGVEPMSTNVWVGEE